MSDTLIDRAADKLFNQLEEGGAIARMTQRQCERLETEDAIKREIGNFLRGFLMAHWPDVQLVESESRGGGQYPSTGGPDGN